MTVVLPPVDARPRPLYSIVAWPPEVLDTWMRRTQQRLNVSGFGLPHMNLRAPFQTGLQPPELVGAFRAALKGEPELNVRLKGWKRLPNVIFLECELSPQLDGLHRKVLDIGPSSRAPYDGQEYRPHLTLALGVLPWAEDGLWQQVSALTPPLQSFTVQALSLTREERGEVQELHTFPLVTGGSPDWTEWENPEGLPHPG